MIQHEALIVVATGGSAVYLIFMSLATRTENLPSALLYKVIPFFLGVLSGIAWLKLVNII